MWTGGLCCSPPPPHPHPSILFYGLGRIVSGWVYIWGQRPTPGLSFAPYLNCYSGKNATRYRGGGTLIEISGYTVLCTLLTIAMLRVGLYTLIKICTNCQGCGAWYRLVVCTISDNCRVTGSSEHSPYTDI